MDSGSTARQDTSIEVDLSFTDALGALGAADPFDPSSIRVVERGGDGAITDAAVPFQFDRAPGFDVATDATGTLTLLLTGTTAPGAQRAYDVYFDVAGSGHGEPVVTDRVIVTDGVADAGEDTVRIATADSTYFYDKDGGGFTSLLDRDGRDWIGYGPATGSAGQFRGIPNMVFPDGTMHPGADGVTTTIVTDGPLKTTLRSTAPGGWVTRWDVFADRARMTVEAAPRAYWFLYEGTPGGLLEPQSDIVVRSDGGEANAATAWTGDLAGEEWAYFGDPGVDRSLYVANHQQDNSVDSYYAMDGNMTVFGFGRTGITSSLTGTGRSFSVGLADGVDRAGVSGRISAAVRPVTVALGAPSTTAPPTTTTTAPPTTTTTHHHHHHRTAHHHHRTAHHHDHHGRPDDDHRSGARRFCHLGRRGARVDPARGHRRHPVPGLLRSPVPGERHTGRTLQLPPERFRRDGTAGQLEVPHLPERHPRSGR